MSRFAIRASLRELCETRKGIYTVEKTWLSAGEN
jgi:hypothetical protein